MLKYIYFIHFLIYSLERWTVSTTENSCVSGLTYRVIPQLSCSSMVNTLEIMLDSETEVSE